MTATAAQAPATDGGVAATFDSLDPRTGDVVGTYPVHDAAAVQAAVARATVAARLVGRAGLRGASPQAGGVAKGPGAAPGRPRARGGPGDRQALRRRPSRTGARRRPPRLGRVPRPEGARPPHGLVRDVDEQPGGVADLRAARCRRRDRALELPRLHADGLHRLRARSRQRRGVQAQRAHPGRRDRARRHARRDRRGTAAAPGGHRFRRDGRGSVPRRGRRQDRVHWVDRHREARDGHLRGDAHARAHRVRRQGPADRRRGRRPRRSRRRHRVGRDVQRGPDLRGRRARVRGRSPSPRRSPRRSWRKACGAAAAATSGR